MSNTIGEVNINLRMSLAQFKQDVKNGTQDASNSTRRMANEVREQTHKAKDSVDLLSDSVGVHLPRELKKVIAQLPGIGKALAAAFSAVAVVAFAQVVIEVIGKVRDLSQEIGGFGEEAKKAYAKFLEGNKEALKSAEELKDKFRELALIGLKEGAKDAKQRNIDLARRADLEEKINLNLKQQREITAQLAAATPTDPRARLGEAITDALHITDDAAGKLQTKLGDLVEEGRKLAESFRLLEVTNTAHVLQADADAAERTKQAIKKLADVMLEYRIQRVKVLETLKAQNPFGNLSELEETPPALNRRNGPQQDFGKAFEIALEKQNTEVLAQAKQVYDATRTAAEQYSDEVDKLVNLLNAGVISEDTFNRAVLQAGEKMDTTVATWREFGKEIGSTLKSAALFGKGWKEALGSIAIELTQVIAKLIIMKNLGAASAAGGGGGIFSSIVSGLAGLGKAKGGPVYQGQGYPVGEQGPEWFVPETSGRIVPNHQLAGGMGGGRTTVVNQNFQMDVHGVTDADSFKKSQDQIASGMLAVMSRAGRRNG